MAPEGPVLRPRLRPGGSWLCLSAGLRTPLQPVPDPESGSWRSRSGPKMAALSRVPGQLLTRSNRQLC
jgi:hypothetical protein